MFILFVISALALSKPNNVIDDIILNHQNSKAENEIPKQQIQHFQKQDIKIKDMLKNQTQSENITHFLQLNNNSVENTTNHHHHSQFHSHHSNGNHQNKRGNVNGYKFNHIKRKLHRRNRFNHYEKPQYHNNSTQKNDRIGSNKSFNRSEKINFTNKEKLLNAKMMKIKEYINKVKEQNNTKTNETNINNTKLEHNHNTFKIDKKLHDELIQKFKTIKPKNHHLRRKKTSFNKISHDDNQLLNKWDENQKQKLQQRINEVEALFGNIGDKKNENAEKRKTNKETQTYSLENQKNISQKQSSEPKSKINEILKSNYLIGGVLFVGVAFVILVIIFQRDHKNDDSNANCQETKEYIDSNTL